MKAYVRNVVKYLTTVDHATTVHMGVACRGHWPVHSLCIDAQFNQSRHMSNCQDDCQTNSRFCEARGQFSQYTSESCVNQPWTAWKPHVLTNHRRQRDLRRPIGYRTRLGHSRVRVNWSRCTLVPGLAIADWPETAKPRRRRPA